MNRTIAMAISLAALAVGGAARAADPWADVVVSYNPGDPVPSFADPAAALGEPTRFTYSTEPFGGVVTPYNPSFGPGETVSLNPGGSLVLQFAEPVANDPLNPFGIDLLVFGNSFVAGDFFGPPPDFAYNPDGLATGVTAGGGLIEVSADGVAWFPVPGDADGLYPTNAYADVSHPFTATPGLVEADFTRPVDPSFSPVGKNFAQIVAGYAGSGGGLGVDIGPTGLSSISFVRITNPADSASKPEIDAVADVASIPEPSACRMIFFAALILLGKTVRAGNVNAAT